jgi:hypothetical protein
MPAALVISALTITQYIVGFYNPVRLHSTLS